MNIGETDVDGWTYVRFGDAAKAAQEGTHDCETKHVAADGDEWKICYSFSSNQYTLYRIREKTRTVTVTIPRPNSTTWETSRSEEPYVKLYFKAGEPVWDICLALSNAIREQS